MRFVNPDAAFSGDPKSIRRFDQQRDGFRARRTQPSLRRLRKLACAARPAITS
jgi:hypothetical protein